jgi:chaperonin GroEL
VISEDVGMTLDKADLSSLGRAKKATVTKDDTILLDGGGLKEDIEDRNEQLRQAIAASTSDYDKYASSLTHPPPKRILRADPGRDEAF